MKMKATQLRASIYKVLDEILASGKPVEIERKGQLLRIEPAQKTSKFARLATHDIMKDEPESFVSSDWSQEWKHDLS